MTEQLNNELVPVKVISGNISDKAVMKLIVATHDIARVGEEVRIFFKTFVDKKGYNTKQPVPDEQSYNRAIGQLQQLGVDTSTLESLNFDDESAIEAEMERIVLELPSQHISETDIEKLPELYVTDTPNGTLITFSKVTPRTDKLGAEFGTKLNNLINMKSRKKEDLIVNLEPIYDAENYGRYLFMFKVELDGAEKLFRIARLDKIEDPDDINTKTLSFKTKYSPDSAYDLSKQINSGQLPDDAVETIRKGIKTQNNTQRVIAQNEFKKVFGRDITELIEKETPVQVRIATVNNADKDTAYIVADEVTFLDEE